jgi:hypothetical protein
MFGSFPLLVLTVIGMFAMVATESQGVLPRWTQIYILGGVLLGFGLIPLVGWILGRTRRRFHISTLRADIDVEEHMIRFAWRKKEEYRMYYYGERDILEFFGLKDYVTTVGLDKPISDFKRIINELERREAEWVQMGWHKIPEHREGFKKMRSYMRECHDYITEAEIEGLMEDSQRVERLKDFLKPLYEKSLLEVEKMIIALNEKLRLAKDVYGMEFPPRRLWEDDL